MFKSIEIKNWRQYQKIDISLHPKLTILTGANGAGKTTLLNLFGKHFGWQSSLVSTPESDEKTGVLKFLPDIWHKHDLSNNIEKPNNLKAIGCISYDNNVMCEITVPNIIGPSYDVIFTNQQVVKGLHIPSHRPIYKYQNISSIPTTVTSKSQAYSQYNSSKVQRHNGDYVQRPENYYIKEALISLAMFGYGNQVVVANEEARKLFEGFENILRIILPPRLGFKKLSVRIPEIVLLTESGDFSFDAISGGVASIMDLAWQIYMSDNEGSKFVVTFDEPENHLHPEMQKTLLPNFLEAFPNIQFIVATHSPFIISSLPDSNVYVLNYNNLNKIDSILLDTLEKTGGANEILREVLGIESTMPNWVNNKIDKIISKYLNNGITADNILMFKEELREVGLDKYVSNSVIELIERSKAI